MSLYFLATVAVDTIALGYWVSKSIIVGTYNYFTESTESTEVTKEVIQKLIEENKELNKKLDSIISQQQPNRDLSGSE